MSPLDEAKDREWRGSRVNARVQRAKSREAFKEEQEQDKRNKRIGRIKNIDPKGEALRLRAGLRQMKRDGYFGGEEHEPSKRWPKWASKA